MILRPELSVGDEATAGVIRFGVAEGGVVFSEVVRTSRGVGMGASEVLWRQELPVCEGELRERKVCLDLLWIGRHFAPSSFSKRLFVSTTASTQRAAPPLASRAPRLCCFLLSFPPSTS